MDSLRVALLNASYNDEATDRNFERDVDATVESFAANEGEIPSHHDWDAVIVSGSSAAAYGDERWIPAVSEWIEGAIDRDVPVFGVCFGHQLLTQILGGDVRDMGDYELGYREVERVGDSELLSGLPEQFLVFETHSDEVVTLPPDAELLAENDCSVQAFRKGHVFGVQFHPEYDRETAVQVTRGKDLPDERIESVLNGITDENVDEAANAKTVFDNFLKYARSCQRGTADSTAG